MPYCLTATSVVNRYLRDSPFPAFQNISYRDLKLIDPTKPSLDDYSYIYCQVNLSAQNSSIIRGILAHLKNAREWLGILPRTHRPASPALLQRDFFAYVLSRAGWELVDIEEQLKYMGCKKLPADGKAYLRKTRARFKRVEEEVRAKTMQTEERQLNYMVALITNPKADPEFFRTDSMGGFGFFPKSTKDLLRLAAIFELEADLKYP